MKNGSWIFLLIILSIATFLRLWRLDSVPPGLYPDEAINGNQALLEPGKIFYPENNGREGLFINLIALSFKFFGPSIFSLRLVSALAGTLTVLGLYLLTKEVFQTTHHPLPTTNCIALLASFFLAISFWHINFSRIAFRAILVPFCLVFSFYFLFKGLRKLGPKTSTAVDKVGPSLDFIVAGIFFGLGFYTYIAFRAAILLVGAFFLLCLFYFCHGREKVGILRGKVSRFVLAAFIIALPLGIYFLKNPQDFIGRAAGVSILAQENPLLAFFESFLRHLLMFNFQGDFNWRHNFSGSPQLFWPIGILFLVGFFLSIKEAVKAFKEKNLLPLTSYLLPLTWFLVMLLPGAFTYESIPHALRTIGVIPVVYIFVGLGAGKVYEIFKRNSKNQNLLIFASILFLVALLVFQYNKYFSNWAQRPEVEAAFSKDYVEIGNYLNSLAPEIEKYVIVNQLGVLVKGIPMPAQTPMFIENSKFGQSRTNYVLPEALNQIRIDKEARIVLMHYDESLLKELAQKFPGGEIEKQNGFWIYKITLFNL